MCVSLPLACLPVLSFILCLVNKYKHTEGIEKVGNEPLGKLLKQMGGWPVIEGDSWNESNFDWLDTLIQYRQNGFSHDLFMDLSVTPDFRNNTRHVIDVSLLMFANKSC